MSWWRKIANEEGKKPICSEIRKVWKGVYIIIFLKCYFFWFIFIGLDKTAATSMVYFFFIRRISYSASSLVEGASSVAGLSLVWGTETDTLIETSRSSTVTVFISSKTFCCSASSSISTNPKPLERPLQKKKKRSWRLESETVKWPFEMSKVMKWDAYVLRLTTWALLTR